MSARTRRSIVAVALASGLALLSGCGPGSSPDGAVEPSATPVSGGTLIVALNADVDSWNPYTTHDATSAGILDLLYPRLVLETGASDPQRRFTPWLAQRWEFSPDRRRLTFHLQPGAVWSNGSPVGCEDVRFTHRAQMAEELAWPGVFIKQRIDRIDCPDALTAVFHFLEAYPDQILDANDNAIVPAAYADTPFDAWASTTWEERIVSAGPFRLASVRPGQEAVLERDPTWWRDPGAYLDRVILRVYPETGGALPRFLDGEVDLLSKVPALQAAVVAARDDLHLIELPSLSYTYLGWNTLSPEAYMEDRRARGCVADAPCEEEPSDLLRLRPHPILADAGVRMALALGIDRQDLVDGVWLGHARIGSSPIVSALPAYDPASAVPFDPRQAERMLDRAGWNERAPDGIRRKAGRKLELEVIVNSGNRVRRDVLERVAAGLERIGVRLLAVPLPRREFVTRARNKQFDVVLSGWWAGTRIQPQNLLHSRSALDRGNNMVSWSTERSDALLDRALVTTDPEEARSLWREWQALFRAEQPLTILYEERRLLGTRARVRAANPSYLNPLQNLHEWWVLPDANPGG